MFDKNIVVVFSFLQQGKDVLTDRNHRVYIIATGGTIEKTYDELKGSLENKITQLEQRILTRLRLPYTEITIETILTKDSLHFTDEDRHLVFETILENLKKDRFDAIIIVHGTDTMVLTADYVRQNIQLTTIPIIFTGAMKPMGFEDSDALQNVTEALMASRLCSSGFFVCFHGRVYNVPFVRKDRKNGTFGPME